LEVLSDDSIAEMKELIHFQERIQPFQPRLIFAGTQLEDGRCLRDGIEKGELPNLSKLPLVVSKIERDQTYRMIQEGLELRELKQILTILGASSCGSARQETQSRE
jgi:hypothetical protein